MRSLWIAKYGRDWVSYMRKHEEPFWTIVWDLLFTKGHLEFTMSGPSAFYKIKESTHADR